MDSHPHDLCKSTCFKNTTAVVAVLKMRMPKRIATIIKTRKLLLLHHDTNETLHHLDETLLLFSVPPHLFILATKQQARLFLPPGNRRRSSRKTTRLLQPLQAKTPMATGHVEALP